MDNKRKGGVTELQCQAYLYRLGYDIAIPFGENSRYDLILDVDGHLLRVQVKTSEEIEDGVFRFSCISTRINRTRVSRHTYSANEVDFFATIYKDICYLVPIAECVTYKTLRLKPAKNGQATSVNFAADYEASVQINKYLNQHKP